MSSTMAKEHSIRHITTTTISANDSAIAEPANVVEHKDDVQQRFLYRNPNSRPNGGSKGDDDDDDNSRPNRRGRNDSRYQQNSRPARTQQKKDFTPRNNYMVGGQDKLWLQAHNQRRKEWHTRYGVSYVPLQWSTILEKEAQDWAERSLSTCGGRIGHDGRTGYGENLASNFGVGRDGEERTPEELLVRWVDREANKDPPNNLHLSQVLWRSSNYVGCGMASRKYGNGGGMCHTQVCRYARPGNCAMGQYNNWQTPTFADDSKCTPFEPISR
jgi:hypothetical protein